jgi:nitroreductase
MVPVTQTQGAADRLHPILGERFSPLRFDPAHRLTAADTDVLLEAARWAPSAGNSQPWAFHVRRREEPEFEVLLTHLAMSSRRWAPDASALVVNLAQRFVGDSDIEYSEFADYDLGQAVAHMTFQAHAMGLACRQFRAFNLDGLRTALDVAAGWQILTMMAVGMPLPQDPPQRHRRSLADLRTAGMYQQREDSARSVSE